MIARQVFYEGNVQGVGFRYSVKQVARGFDVTGFVRNVADGRVELQAAGAESELQDFLRAVSESGLRAHIKTQVEHPLPPSEAAFRGFSIRHE